MPNAERSGPLPDPESSLHEPQRISPPSLSSLLNSRVILEDAFRRRSHRARDNVVFIIRGRREKRERENL